MNRDPLPETSGAVEALEIVAFIAVFFALAIGLISVLTGHVDRGAKCLCCAFIVGGSLVVFE